MQRGGSHAQTFLHVYHLASVTCFCNREVTANERNLKQINECYWRKSVIGVEKCNAERTKAWHKNRIRILTRFVLF